MLGGIVATIAGFRQFVLRGSGRPGWDALKLRMPILGRLIRQTEAARFARSLGILTKAGVSITQAMAVVIDTLQNTVVRNAVSALAQSIQGGESIALPLQRSGLFPPLLVQMVRVGENTGKLDEMLLRSANVHESEAKVTLEPVGERAAHSADPRAGMRDRIHRGRVDPGHRRVSEYGSRRHARPIVDRNNHTGQRVPYGTS